MSIGGQAERGKEARRRGGAVVPSSSSPPLVRDDLLRAS